MFLVDWLQFTLHSTALPEVYDLIGIPETDFVDMPTGRYSYAARKSCGGISIMYQGRDGMGIHVEFEGQGCRQYETYYDVPWEVLFARIVDAGGDFSRLDLAIDEHRFGNDKPYWQVKQLVRKTKQGHARSKFRTANRIEKINMGDGSSGGDTIYFGSAQSDIQFRAYQKDLERLGAGFDLLEGLTTWNRFEVQLADVRARNAVLACLEGRTADHLVNGIIRQYLNFCNPGGDSNKARWPVCSWWDDYLGDAVKLRLAEKAPDKTIERKKEWIDRQVSPTLAEIWVAEGSPGLEWLGEYINRGLDRMTDQQWARADNYAAAQRRERTEREEQRQERRQAQLRVLEKQLERNRQKFRLAEIERANERLAKSLERRLKVLAEQNKEELREQLSDVSR